MSENRRSPQAPRPYRDLVADGQAQLDAIVDRCPHCRSVIVAAPPVRPAGMPDRDDEAREQRRRELEPTAARLAEHVRGGLPEHSFAIWVSRLVLDDAAAGTLFFSAPPELAAWLAQRYAPFIASAASSLAGRRLMVEIYPAVEAPPSGATLGELVADTPTTSEAAA